MLQVSCLYCGKTLTAKDEWVGKKVKCPACNHVFLVHKPRQLGDSAGANADTKNGEQDWRRKSNTEIAQMLLNRYDVKIPEAKTGQEAIKAEAIKNRQAEYWASKTDEEIAHALLEDGDEPEASRPFFLPRYDDATLFTLSITLLLLLAVNAQLQDDIKTLLAFKEHIDPRLYVLAAAFVLGMLLSLVNVFIRRQKSGFEKSAMLIFAVVVTAGAGIYAGFKMFESYRGWLMIFPIWNIINGVLLLLYVRAGVITTKCITDETASFFDIASSLVVITILLGLCQYFFKLHWVYTYSIVVCYTMSLHSVLQDFLPKRMTM